MRVRDSELCRSLSMDIRFIKYYLLQQSFIVQCSFEVNVFDQNGTRTSSFLCVSLQNSLGCGCASATDRFPVEAVKVTSLCGPQRARRSVWLPARSVPIRTPGSILVSVKAPGMARLLGARGRGTGLSGAQLPSTRKHSVQLLLLHQARSVHKVPSVEEDQAPSRHAGCPPEQNIRQSLRQGLPCGHKGIVRMSRSMTFHLVRKSLQRRMQPHESVSIIDLMTWRAFLCKHVYIWKMTKNPYICAGKQHPNLKVCVCFCARV